MLVSGPALTAAAATASRPAEAAPGLVLLPAGGDGVEVVARFFRALADSARLRLLELLLPGEHTVTSPPASWHSRWSNGRPGSAAPSPATERTTMYRLWRPSRRRAPHPDPDIGGL